MLLDRFATTFDETEIHRIQIDAPADVVWRELWVLDLFGSPIVKALMALRSIPKTLSSIFAKRGGDPSEPSVPRTLTLHDLEGAGFGRLASTEEPIGGANEAESAADNGRYEVVFGVEGKFWRPAGNLSPFRREAFDRPPPAGTCHAYWNFLVQPTSDGKTELYTETRIRAGDPASRRKFRAYWFLVRPFSGLIRLRMLRAVARVCRG